MLFGWFKKLSKKEENQEVEVEERLETIFPPAEDMLERTKRAWSEKKPEEILEKMNKESANGHRYASFFNATLSERTERELIQQHYHLEKDPHMDAPHFKVSW